MSRTAPLNTAAARGSAPATPAAASALDYLDNSCNDNGVTASYNSGERKGTYAQATDYTSRYAESAH